ncbi:hypothetical protein [Mycobacterium sp.]|uniref:hypothetical protein n=1 Tax=Mycobacterium sp. TaxID=1785 RepID=UPI003A89B90F
MDIKVGALDRRGANDEKWLRCVSIDQTVADPVDHDCEGGEPSYVSLKEQVNDRWIEIDRYEDRHVRSASPDFSRIVAGEGV